ncbi:MULTISPECIES: hypothetical protein [unclassified Fusibacter]|uniref:hypothetical protein n=1 Tax=unclassified Fusibacter TaxID=2624464 RepID=UPI0010137BF1|nr:MULTISPECIES: hypothetical protein [unclassified Fusibacter]MCK8061338.1 hypothetical protein [Fusibacter sp. A2]NPE23465.1 hypothetical protein [Fusibacter sp. A1]RXV59071.1 hypothetical protein DWB64_16740 [Fusibacter sp. A1]
MAWDRIQIGRQLNKPIPVHGWKYFSMGIVEEGVNGYSLSHNGIDLVYFPNMFGRRILKISFNLGKLYHGDNIASIWACNLQELHQRLNCLLDGIINLNDIGLIRYWNVYQYECFADFVIHELDMNAWIKVISKSSIKYRQIDPTYVDRGTIYFHSSKLLADSHTNVKIYDKLKHKRDIESKHNLPRVDYNQSELINLPLGYRILRVEIFYDKDRVKLLNKREAIVSTNIISTPNIMNAYDPTPEHCFFTVEELFSYSRQVRDLGDVISELHLDRPVTTTKKLIAAVKELGYSNTITKNVIDTLKYINNPKRYKKFNDDRIRRHKLIIKETGYHFISSNRELHPLSLDNDVISRLPDEQKEMINRYYNSNIFRDYFR